QQEMDDANQGLGGGLEQVQYPVRRQAFAGLTATPFTQNSVHPLPLIYQATRPCLRPVINSSLKCETAI
ncbi:hypothetical protein, partial [Pseudomonas fluorescens]|uniref:hypothetical protein n=1 Tax=Pseudomonas fluorescens TaxID=294 RepID=UPI001CD262E2